MLAYLVAFGIAVWVIRRHALIPRTTPVLHLADEGAKDCVAEGLGQSQPMDPGPVTWVDEPTDGDWLTAVTK